MSTHNPLTEPAETPPINTRDAYHVAVEMMSDALAAGAGDAERERELLIEAMNAWGDLYGKGYKSVQTLMDNYYVEVQPDVNGPKLSIVLTLSGYSITRHEHCFD